MRDMKMKLQKVFLMRFNLPYHLSWQQVVPLAPNPQAQYTRMTRETWLGVWLETVAWHNRPG